MCAREGWVIGTWLPRETGAREGLLSFRSGGLGRERRPRVQGQHQAQGSNSHGHHTSSFHPPTPRQQSSEAPLTTP